MVAGFAAGQLVQLDAVSTAVGQHTVTQVQQDGGSDQYHHYSPDLQSPKIQLAMFDFWPVVFSWMPVSVLLSSMA